MNTNTGVENVHRHKSTTHEEMYFHVRQPSVAPNGKAVQGGTVFARKERNGWFLSISYCSERDNWCYRSGRTAARRRYFSFEPSSRIEHGEVKPTYEDAASHFPPF